jgi:hypothetical protein
MAHKDMQANFEKFILRVGALVVELRDRGVGFLDRYMRVSHLKLLRSELQLREIFEREVMSELKSSGQRQSG